MEDQADPGIRHLAVDRIHEHVCLCGRSIVITQLDGIRAGLEHADKCVGNVMQRPDRVGDNLQVETGYGAHHGDVEDAPDKNTKRVPESGTRWKVRNFFLSTLSSAGANRFRFQGYDLSPSGHP